MFISQVHNLMCIGRPIHIRLGTEELSGRLEEFVKEYQLGLTLAITNLS